MKHSLSVTGMLKDCQILSYVLFIYFFSSTRSSISLASIKSKLRWMLTGTPVTNTLYVLFIVRRVLALIYHRADIYGLLRFGRFRPWNDWADFNDHVVSVNKLVALS